MNTIVLETELLTTDLRPRIATEITCDIAALLSGRYTGEIRYILEQRGVVVFHELHMTDDEQRSFAATLGQVLPQGNRGLFQISLDKAVSGPAAAYLRGAFFWHIDGANDDIPTRAVILNAKKLSPTGGETEFCNTYDAWEELPASEKQRIEKLRVVHSFEVAQRFVNPTPTVAELREWQGYPTKVHPLVWTHRSGRKSLVLGCTASHIEGMDPAEGRLLLCELTEWATQPKFVYQHHWRMGDLLMWDNTGTMHRAVPYDPACGRLMTRACLAGEEPLV